MGASGDRTAMTSCPYHAADPNLAPPLSAASGRGDLGKLTCYRLHHEVPRIVPGQSAREWMDRTPERYAYRCLPLTIANAMGWEILAPCRVDVTWNGGRELGDLTVTIDDPAWGADRLASSHFGSGIVTFHTGYLFRTEPGVGVWARGAPNLPKDGIAPLEGVIETDWLPFSFTMNWMMTRPGHISFAADEPFCFITPLAYRGLDDMVPEIVAIESDPERHAAFTTWRDARRDFNNRLLADEPATVKQGWQKWYMRGEMAADGRVNPDHRSKLSLAPPRIVDASESGPRDL